MAATVQSMCLYWKNFDLTQLQKELDTTATDLANRQDESDGSRKRLVEQSREFKKNTAEDIRKVVAPLLKGFQAEIDSLSKRSKAAEAAFLSMYKKLIDLPDPVPVFEHVILIQEKAHRVQDLEIENKQLRDTLADYNNEFAEVKNQEVTIKQLKDRLRDYEERMELTAEARAKEKERELQKSFMEKQRHLHETQMTVATKLGEAEERATSFHAALETAHSEMFEVKAKYEEATSAKSDEMDMVMADLERANERASGAERQIDQLMLQISVTTQNMNQAGESQKTSNMEQAIDNLKRTSLEVELTAKEKETRQLVDDIQKLQASLNKLREITTAQVTKLEEEVSGKNKAFKVLEEKIQSQEDYEEIKRELSIMKSIQFPGDDSDATKTKSLELLLLEKNKSLQTETTRLKVADGELKGEEEGTLDKTDDFATLLGEEIAASYHKSRSRASTPTVNGISSEKSSPKHNNVNRKLLENHHMVPVNHTYSHDSCPENLAPTHLKSHMESDRNHPLDTAMVAKTVREILSMHNLGQRLFAKHVLGLSQGTVSELLSKPKSWEKLTEKGRESYRKMYAWASEPRNIMSLKALSPRKGAQPLVSSVPRENNATDERIAQILNGAQQAMQIKKNAEQQQVTNAMVASIYQQEMAKLASTSSNQMASPNSICMGNTGLMSPKPPGAKRGHSGDKGSRSSSISKESDASAKDMVARIYHEELRKLADAATSSGNIAASTLYQQELARLAHNVQHDDRFGDHRKYSMSQNSMLVKTEPPDSTSDDTMSLCNNNTPIDLSKPHRNSMQSPDEYQESLRHTGSAFFLVRPRLNGLDGGEVSPRFPGSSESLSPLQRMQHIANSLMSRPQLGNPSVKPLRAVLPPISQDQFDKYANMDTDELVKKVKETLSQYSISQRLFGENVLGLSQGSVSDLLARPKPWHMLTQKGREPFIRMQLFLEDAESIPKLVSSQYRIPPEKLMRTNSQSQEPASPQMHEKAHLIPSNSPASSDASFEAAWAVMGGYPATMFEIAAMTSDMDTLEVTSRVKDVLLFHNLGQKLFGEAILGLSQGSVSELLSKPKPWHMLSIKGREPFIKMHMWLTDPNNIERLKQYQNDLKVCRRRKGSIDDRYFDPPHAPKRPRIFFNEDQKEALRLAYLQDPYPNQTTIEELAAGLNIGVKTVVNWFHNHRMRAKQQQHSGNSDSGQMSIKSEPLDENSNQSELSSYSGDMEPNFSHYPLGDTGQWMFPRFEPVYSKSQEEIAANKPDQDCHEEIKSCKETREFQENETTRNLQQPTSVAVNGVNKRKRGNPKWAYEGTQLDKTMERLHVNAKSHLFADANANTSEDSANAESEIITPSDANLNETVASEDSGDETSLDSEDGRLFQERANKIRKMQKAIETTEAFWDECDAGASIEKLEKSIADESEEDWEF